MRVVVSGGDGEGVPARVVPQHVVALVSHDVRLRLAIDSARGDRRPNLALWIAIDDDAVLGELLLDEDDLLGALDNEISARVARALPHPCEHLVGHPVQDAL